MNAQELIIGHLLPIAATVAVLWLVYRLLFRNSNRLYFNRFFLLTSMLLALAMPLLGLLSGTELPQMATLKQSMFSGMMLNEVIVTPDGQPVLPEVSVTTTTAPSRFSLWQVIGGLYIIGVAVMLILFLVKLGKLVVLIARSPKRKMSGCTAVFTGRDQGSFSFMGYAIFPNENVDADIMRHEMSHIEHHHSWDILFAEVMMILQWFNPFIYLYKKELQSLHEYQADRDVVATGVNTKDYMMLILQQCTATDFSGISNNFSLILTKKRIKVITRNEKAKGLWWRLLATLPVLALLMIANTKVTAQEQKAVENADIALNGNTNLRREMVADAPEKDTVFQVVEQMPKFPGGDQAMFDYISKNVKYPEQAKESGIQGRVFVSFVVEKDGSVSNVEVARGIGGGCDEEGIRVVKSMPKWTPGQQAGKAVRVYYTLPIFFKLDDPTPQSKNKDDMKPDKNGVYSIVEEMPRFPGDDKALMEYIQKNLIMPEKYKGSTDENPKLAEYRTFVRFVVNEDGSISDIQLLRKSAEFKDLDEEAIRVVKSMPNWEPGKIGGKPVKVYFSLPIIFKFKK